MTVLCSAQLAVGDIIYLAATGPAQYQHGFQLCGPEQPLAGQEEQVCCASSAKSCLTVLKILKCITAVHAKQCNSISNFCNVSRKAEQPWNHAPAPQAASSSASALLSNVNQESSAQGGCFKGKHIVFWTRSHTATLKQKATQAGAILEHKITEHTQLVVAARDTSATDAAAHLADLPPSLPLRSKKWEGRKLKIPTSVDFVVPQYISDCLVQAHILPTGPYQIALQQVATKDTRTYSNEECARNSSEPPEVSQLNSRDLTSGQSPQQDTINAHSADQGTPDASSSAHAQLQPQEMLPQATMQKAAPPEQSGADQKVDPHSEKKIGIYPEVDPQGRSFTGGHSGIPWGTGED